MKALILVLFLTALIVMLIVATRSNPFKKGEPLSDSLNKTKTAAGEATLTVIASALQGYQEDNGEFPETLEALIPQFLRRPQELVDPWGNPIQYQKNEQGDATLTSAGPDGQLATGDDIQRNL